MRRVQVELAKQDLLNPVIDFFLNTFVWREFHELKSEGRFDISIWIFHKDISSIVAEILTDLFGPDPEK